MKPFYDEDGITIYCADEINEKYCELAAMRLAQGVLLVC